MLYTDNRNKNLTFDPLYAFITLTSNLSKTKIYFRKNNYCDKLSLS